MQTFEQFTEKQTDAAHIVSIVKSALSMEVIVDQLVVSLEEKSKQLSKQETELITLKEENKRLTNVIKHLEDVVLSVPQ